MQAYLEIAKEFQRFDKRWQEVSKSLATSIKKVNDFETTVNKIIKKNDDLMKMQPENKPVNPPVENITNLNLKSNERSDREDVNKEKEII